MNSILVVVRTPTYQSVQPWLLAVAGDEGVDLAVSTYNDTECPDGDLTKIEFSHHFVGGKWIAIYDFIRSHPHLLDKYDYFWFPDDDIETSADIAREFIALCRDERFAIAQPSLTIDSYYAHRVTLTNSRFRFRRTNFVELMMPLMSATFLRRVLPLFADRHAALGIDLFWHKLAPNPMRDVAIVDATPMGHYRPRQTHLKNVMSKQQIDILSEKQKTFEYFSIYWVGATIISAETTYGKEVGRGFLMWWMYFLGMSSVRKRICRPQCSRTKMLLMLYEMVSTDPEKPCYDHERYLKVFKQKSIDGVSSSRAVQPL
ncbi:DUF707 domain-containing protein [Agrobacterium sp. ES01]|uniref:DUF707 domain-containing protein n=1 Tax=Agrobacterium sp. ES01 TaxID=3420714 RepID=UPI003D141D9F